MEWTEVGSNLFEAPKFLPKIASRTSLAWRWLGSFSIYDGNGSENVSFKMNSRFFNLRRVYSILMKMASVGKFPWNWFLEDHTQV